MVAKEQGKIPDRIWAVFVRHEQGGLPRTYATAEKTKGVEYVRAALAAAQPKDGIADAVISWMVERDMLDGGNEYYASDVVAALNDLVSEPAAQPKVKALGWTDTGNYLDGRGVVGWYEIQKGGSAYDFSLNGRYTREVFTTIDKAKAAAQADYEARILSALDTGEGE